MVCPKVEIYHRYFFSLNDLVQCPKKRLLNLLMIQLLWNVFLVVLFTYFS